jgi:hypothetical protein
MIFRVPLEELLFEFTFGTFWFGLSEDLFWLRVTNKNLHGNFKQNGYFNLHKT